MRVLQLLPAEAESSGGLERAAAEIAHGHRSLGHVVERRRSERTALAARRPGVVSHDRSVAGRHDVVEVWDRLLPVRTAARSPGARTVLMVTESRHSVFAGARWMEVPAMRLRARRVVRAADCIVVPSSYAARDFPDAPHVARIPLGVDLETFAPIRRSRRRSVIQVATVSGLSARDSTVTAIATLRAIIARGSAASLTVIGDGDPGPRSAWSDVPVRFLGRVTDRHIVAEALTDADVTIAPNPREAFGLAALESMACGTPVVVPANSGAAELVTARTGIAVPPGPRGFASAVLEISRWPVSARRRAARLRAEEFPWDQTISLLLDAYAGLGIDVHSECEPPPAERAAIEREATAQR